MNHANFLLITDLQTCSAIQLVPPIKVELSTSTTSPVELNTSLQCAPNRSNVRTSTMSILLLQITLTENLQYNSNLYALQCYKL